MTIYVAKVVNLDEEFAHGEPVVFDFFEAHSTHLGATIALNNYFDEAEVDKSELREGEDYFVDTLDVVAD